MWQSAHLIHKGVRGVFQDELPGVDLGVDVSKRRMSRRRPFSTMRINEMPLDVIRLRASDLVNKSTGEEFKAAILLWCFAWHQNPPGTIPNDDRILSRIVGVHIITWRTIKNMALHGFIKRDDGRLEHPLIAAYAGREEQEHLRRRRISTRTSANIKRQKDRMHKAYDFVKAMGVNIDEVNIQPGNNQGDSVTSTHTEKAEV